MTSGRLAAGKPTVATGNPIGACHSVDPRRFAEQGRPFDTWDNQARKDLAELRERQRKRARLIKIFWSASMNSRGRPPNVMNCPTGLMRCRSPLKSWRKGLPIGWIPEHFAISAPIDFQPIRLVSAQQRPHELAFIVRHAIEDRLDRAIFEEVIAEEQDIRETVLSAAWTGMMTTSRDPRHGARATDLPAYPAFSNGGGSGDAR